MLTAIAKKLSDSIIRQGHIDPQRKKIYVYGCELFLSTGLGMTSIFLISLLLKRTLAGITFLVIFVSLRLFAGGFHASSYLRCFLLSNSVFIATCLLSEILSHIPNIYSLGLLFMSSLLVFFLAPIRNAKHPLSDEKYAKNKAIARFLSIFEPYLVLIIYIITSYSHFLSVSTASVFAVSLMMISPKINQLRRESHE